MKRKIYLEVTIDWEDYEDICDELCIEDSGIFDSLKTGVFIEIMKDNNNNRKNTIIEIGDSLAALSIEDAEKQLNDRSL